MINSESFIAFFLSWVKWPSNTTWYVIRVNPYLFKSMGYTIHDLWKTNAPAIVTLRKPSLRTLVLSDLPSWVIRDLLGSGAWLGYNRPPDVEVKNVSHKATGAREGEPDPKQRAIRQRRLHHLEKQTVNSQVSLTPTSTASLFSTIRFHH